MQARSIRELIVHDEERRLYAMPELHSTIDIVRNAQSRTVQEHVHVFIRLPFGGRQVLVESSLLALGTFITLLGW